MEAPTFWVHVQPRARRREIAGTYRGALKVRVTAPPLAGRANEELVWLLAETLGVPRSAVEIVAGETSRRKRVRVHGLTPEQLRVRLLR